MCAFTFGSLFSGCGGMDLGLEAAGMKAEWMCEIDPYCRKILAKRWPGMVIHHDVRQVGKENLSSVDLIAGGFPCQGISVANRNGGGGCWTRVADCSMNCGGSFARFDPDMFSWRTCPTSGTEASEMFSGKWPSAGTMQNGTLFRRNPSGAAREEIGCSLSELERTRMYPTPTASMGQGGIGYMVRALLRNDLRRPSGQNMQLRLDGVLIALDYMERGYSAEDLPDRIQNNANPEFVEWLTGFPIGWTGLELLGTRSLPSWPDISENSSSNTTEGYAPKGGDTDD